VTLVLRRGINATDADYLAERLHLRPSGRAHSKWQGPSCQARDAAEGIKLRSGVSEVSHKRKSMTPMGTDAAWSHSRAHG